MFPRKGPYKSSYDEAMLEEALEAMRAGMSSREAERLLPAQIHEQSWEESVCVGE